MKRLLFLAILLVSLLAVGCELTPTPKAPGETQAREEADHIEFGTGQDLTSDVLGLVGITDTFDEGAEIWMRVRLKSPLGKPRVDFFLEQRGEAGGWYTLDTWASTGDPDSNILRGQPRSLRSLQPGDYKVFVVIGDEKRAEGFFTVTPAAVADPTTAPEDTPTPEYTPTPTATEALDIINKNASAKWGDDYSMVKYEVEKQTEAYEWLVKQDEYPDIMERAKEKWGDDYSMVKYEYEKQVEAYRALQ